MTIPIDWSLSLGRNVRKARQAKGWNMRDFAMCLEVSPSYVNAIEKDFKIPAVAVLRAIAKETGFDESDLLARAGKMAGTTRSYVEDHPLALRLIEEIAEAELCDEEIHDLIARVKFMGRYPVP